MAVVTLLPDYGPIRIYYNYPADFYRSTLFNWARRSTVCVLRSSGSKMVGALNPNYTGQRHLLKINYNNTSRGPDMNRLKRIDINVRPYFISVEKQ